MLYFARGYGDEDQILVCRLSRPFLSLYAAPNEGLVDRPLSSRGGLSTGVSVFRISCSIRIPESTGPEKELETWMGLYVFADADAEIED